MRASPFDSLAARGGCVIHAFVATSRKYRRSAGRLRRCEPPPPPNDLPMAIVHLGGLRNCSFCMPHPRGCPWFVTKMFISRTAGPGRRQTATAVPTSHVCMRWVRRRFAPPRRPGRVSCHLVTVLAMQARPTCTLLTVTPGSLLDAASSSCWSINGQQFGTVGQDVEKIVRVQERGFPRLRQQHHHYIRLKGYPVRPNGTPRCWRSLLQSCEARPWPVMRTVSQMSPPSFSN